MSGQWLSQTTTYNVHAYASRTQLLLQTPLQTPLAPLRAVIVGLPVEGLIDVRQLPRVTEVLRAAALKRIDPVEDQFRLVKRACRRHRPTNLRPANSLRDVDVVYVERPPRFLRHPLRDEPEEPDEVLPSLAVPADADPLDLVLLELLLHATYSRLILLHAELLLDLLRVRHVLSRHAFLSRCGNPSPFRRVPLPSVYLGDVVFLIGITAGVDKLEVQQDSLRRFPRLRRWDVQNEIRNDVALLCVARQLRILRDTVLFLESCLHLATNTNRTQVSSCTS